MATLGTTSRAGAVAATIGNVLEWYDFVLFGFLSVIMAKQFFPATSPYAAMLLTTATFGASYVVRPLGGVLLGRYADRAGRKAGLTLVIGMMTVAAAIIAFAPTYAQIGILAPILILIARLLQGVSAGGEFGTATAMLIEYAPAGRRSLYGSWQIFAQAFGALLAVAMAAMLTNFFRPEVVDAWAWRIPFAFGLLIGPVGYYIRQRVPETEAFQRLERRESVPFGVLFARYRRALLVATALSAAANVMVYVIIVYLPIYAVQSLAMPASLPFNVLLVSIILRVSMVPVFGHLGDRFGPKRVMAIAMSIFLVALYPGYLWITRAPSMTSIMTVELVFAVLIAASTSPSPTATAELFPTEVRSTGLALSYNVAASVFGGFSPFVLTWLLHATGDPLIPAHYCAAFFVVGLIGTWMLPRESPR